jgi:tetratricopeptide (TPR) repeat protein
MTQIALSAVLHSATTLMRSGRWADADHLLEAVTPADPAEQLALTALRAEVAVDQDFAQATNTGVAALELFEKALTDTPDETHRWDFAMLTLRKTYGTALRSSDQPAEKVAQGNGLGRQAEALRDSAPDPARAGHAAFYAGVIADNLRTQPAEAFAHYTTALELGERSGDQMVISLALRHLGDHAHTAGDLKLARAQWERSTELRQQIGHLFGALAQQALLAVLLEDEGNPAGAAVLATEINRWSRQVDLPWLTAQTAALMPAGSGGGSDHQAGGEDD